MRITDQAPPFREDPLGPDPALTLTKEANIMKVRNTAFAIAAAGAVLALGATTASAATDSPDPRPLAAPAAVTLVTARPAAPPVHVAAAPALHNAALSASAASAARNAINAWENSPGNTYLGNAAAALDNRDPGALAHWAALAAQNPEPFEVSLYVNFMREYAAAGTELASGQASAGRAQISLATSNASAYNQDLAGIMARVSTSGLSG